MATFFDTYSQPGLNPEHRRAFSEVLPFEQIFPTADIRGLAESQVMPEVQRERGRSLYDLGRSMAQTGGYRTGGYGHEQSRLQDWYSRQGKERTQEFMNPIQDWATQWYNEQAYLYGTNPGAYNMPTLPTWGDYFSSQGMETPGGAPSAPQAPAAPAARRPEFEQPKVKGEQATGSVLPVLGGAYN